MRNQTSVAPKSKDVVDTTAELSSAPGIKKARLCSGIDRCPSEAITRSFDFALQIYGEKMKPPNIFPKKLTSLLQLFLKLSQKQQPPPLMGEGDSFFALTNALYFILAAAPFLLLFWLSVKDKYASN